MDSKTQIKLLKIKSTPNRAELTLSSLEKPLIVAAEVVNQHRLVAGVILTASQSACLIAESELFLCHSKANRLLTMRPHSVGELTEKLKRHGFQPEQISQVLKKFSSMGALDDDKYALSLAERMIERRPCGKSMLLAHLYRKKIRRELAEQVVEMVLRGREENELAKASLEKRWSALGQIELETARRKAYNYLSRRGFSYQAARTAFEELSKRTDEGMSD